MNKMTMEIRALCYAYTPNLHLLRYISYMFEGGKAYECDLLGKRAAGKVLKRIYPPLVRAYRC